MVAHALHKEHSIGALEMPRSTMQTLTFNLSSCGPKLRGKDGMHDVVRAAVEKSGMTLSGKLRVQTHKGGDDSVVHIPFEKGSLQLWLYHHKRLVFGVITIIDSTEADGKSVRDLYQGLSHGFQSRRPDSAFKSHIG